MSTINLPITWLTAPADPADHERDMGYERQLRKLFRANKTQHTPELLSHQLQQIERETLLQKKHPSARQQARMWFFVGTIYQHQSKLQYSFESYDLCSRHIPPLESSALLAVHATWAPVAFDLHFNAQAYTSYNLIIDLLTRSEHGLDIIDGATHVPLLEIALARRAELIQKFITPTAR